jgi:hypothetical protein
MYDLLTLEEWLHDENSANSFLLEVAGIGDRVSMIGYMKSHDSYQVELEFTDGRDRHILTYVPTFEEAQEILKENFPWADWDETGW